MNNVIYNRCKYIVSDSDASFVIQVLLSAQCFVLLLFILFFGREGVVSSLSIFLPIDPIRLKKTHLNFVKYKL